MNFNVKIESPLSNTYAHAYDKEEEFTKTYQRYAEDIYRLCYSFMKNSMVILSPNPAHAAPQLQ